MGRKLGKQHGDLRGVGAGGRRPPEYNIWRNMRNRCNNPKAKDFQHYGGRGITVCAEWANSYRAFLSAIGRRPSPNHSIDRVDNDRGYEPGNVKWSTMKEQRANKRPPSAIREQQPYWMYRHNGGDPYYTLIIPYFLPKEWQMPEGG